MSDSHLKCTVCGRESTTSFASSLRTGWEKCCGYTMRLIRTEADLDAAIGEAIDRAHVELFAALAEDGWEVQR